MITKRGLGYVLWIRNKNTILMLYTYEDDPNCQYYRDLFITIRGLWFVLWIRSMIDYNTCVISGIKTDDIVDYLGWSVTAFL